VGGIGRHDRNHEVPAQEAKEVAFEAKGATPSSVATKGTIRKTLDREGTFVPADAAEIRLDLDSWFRTGASGPLVNPATANQGGANKSLVDNNIKNAIKAFEDDDRDGDERDG